MNCARTTEKAVAGAAGQASVILAQKRVDAPTMGSFDIAVLVELRHDNVKRTIEMLARRGVITLPQVEEVPNPGPGPRFITEYRIGQRDSYVIVAQLSPEFTGRLVDRWQELETQQQAAAPTLPRSYKEALLALVAAEEEKEALAAEVADLAPKAEFHDAVTSAINDQTVQEVAQVLGTGQNRLFAFLRAEGLLMRNNLPYQRHIDAGHFHVVEQTYEDRRGQSRTYTRTLVTGKGFALIQKRLNSSTGGRA